MNFEMKKIIKRIVLYSSIITFNIVKSQVGINTTNVDASAALDINSTDKGVLFPRMDSYPSFPANGLTIYRTDLNGYYTWDATSSLWTQKTFGATSGTVSGVTAVPPLSVIGTSALPNISLDSSGVAPGTYNSVTVDAHGLVTGATNTVTSVSNTILGGNLTTTVNGVTGVSIPINNALVSTGNTITSTLAGGTPQTITVPNLYTIDETLTGNRTVTMDNNNLNFSSTNGNFSFTPTGTGNVGIGTNTPTAQLHTTGNVRLAGLGSSVDNARVVSIDNTGNVSTRLSTNFLPATLSGLSGTDLFSSFTPAVIPGTGTLTKNLATVTFNLPIVARVRFKYNVSTQIYKGTWPGTSIPPTGDTTYNIKDAIIRYYAVQLTFTSTPAAYTGVATFLKSDIAFQAGATATTSIYTSGYYNLGKSREIILPPGSYTVALEGYLNSVAPDGMGVAFGYSVSDYLDVTAYPSQ